MNKAIFAIFFIIFATIRIIRAEGGKYKDVDTLTEASEECRKHFNVDISSIRSLVSTGNVTDENDITVKCYVRCILGTTGIITSDGAFDPERGTLIYAGKGSDDIQDNVRARIVKCSDRNESCQCEKAYNFIKCFLTSLDS